MKPKVTSERLQEVLHYDAATGVFTWLVSPRYGRQVGDVAGWSNHHGYLWIKVDGCRHCAHQWAWFYMTGTWPAAGIDHTDGDKLNNRWGNLRLATRSQNAANARRPRHNTSGFKGVSWHGFAHRWHAQIKQNQRVFSLGYFDTPEGAHAAYAAAARERFGEFARSGS